MLCRFQGLCPPPLICTLQTHTHPLHLSVHCDRTEIRSCATISTFLHVTQAAILALLADTNNTQFESAQIIMAIYKKYVQALSTASERQVNDQLQVLTCMHRTSSLMWIVTCDFALCCTGFHKGC